MDVRSEQAAASGDEDSSVEDRDAFADELERRRAEADMEVPIVAALRAGAANPVQPTRYRAGDTLRFACHPGVSCWNQCCHDTQIVLTPYDLIRLGRHLGMRTAEVAARFAAPMEHEASGMPVLRLGLRDVPGERKPCVFLDPERGCNVYNDRPAACRYYPLGLASVKMKGHDAPEDFYFLVKESHCKGHEQAREQTVAQFREEQQVADYDEQNRGWMQILMKLASWKSLGGPWGKQPDERVRQMFLMVSADPDAFRRFVFGSSFLEKYAVDPAVREQLEHDDETLMHLGFDWLRAVLFNEPTLHLREHVLQAAIAKARCETGAV
ncbi:MAG TPA: YkgJ family cysteine cluster protein [Burkholderiaceae bacterium]|nr:YkgJ family cysteine cluster protein [Burkholderiaceae bacterium]